MRSNKSFVRFIHPRAAFSLVELLFVIAVIGTLTGVAIAAMSGIFGQAEATAVERNAQNIVAHFNAARGAGNQTSFSDPGEAIAAITSPAGMKGGGDFASAIFTCPLSSSESAKAKGEIISIGTGANLTLAIKP